jgi:hypothetical protein
MFITVNSDYFLNLLKPKREREEKVGGSVKHYI